MSQPPAVHDVVIAGAGPVGLFLACELRLARVSVLVLEKADDPHSALKGPPFGVRGLSTPSIEALYRRGLLDAVAMPAAARQETRRAGGHFAGIPFDAGKVDASRWPYRLSDATPATMPVTMARLESVLRDRALELGVEIRRGTGVDGFTQCDDHVTVHAGARTFAARWLVGCDGGRSAVRKAGGFAFTGTDPEFTGYSFHADLADPGQLAAGRHYTQTGMYFQSQPGVIAMVEFDGGRCHRTQPVTLDHLQAVLRRVAGTRVTLTALHQATTWTDRAFQAATYRDGRVLLAGDAAHIHSPLGGQGLNLGLGDAMNLGWKLAVTLRGGAPQGLLDTYADERHPAGARVLEWSRAQVALMRPSPHARALEAIVRDLIDTRDGATYFAGRLWGVAQRYDLGDSHPLVGCSAPDVEWLDGKTLGALLREGRGVFLDFDARAPRFAWRAGDRIAYVAGDVRNRLGLSAMLVRPDGIVAWAGEAAPDFDAAASAAARWFGEPRTA